MGWYTINQSHNWESERRTFSADHLGEDLNEVLGNLNLIEKYLGLDQSIWHYDYGSPLYTASPHMVIQPGGGDIKAYLRDRIDFVRDYAGVEPFEWQWVIPSNLWVLSDPRTGVNLKHILELKQAIGRLVGFRSSQNFARLYEETQTNNEAPKITFKRSFTNLSKYNLYVSIFGYGQGQVMGSKNFEFRKDHKNTTWDQYRNQSQEPIENTQVHKNMKRSILAVKPISDTNEGDLEKFESDNLDHIRFYSGGTTIGLKNNLAVVNNDGTNTVLTNRNIVKQVGGAVIWTNDWRHEFKWDNYHFEENDTTSDTYTQTIKGSSILETQEYPPIGLAMEGYRYYWLTWPIGNEQIDGLIEVEQIPAYTSPRNRAREIVEGSSVSDIPFGEIDAKVESIRNAAVYWEAGAGLSINGNCYYRSDVSFSPTYPLVFGEENQGIEWLYWLRPILGPYHPEY